MSQLFDDIDKIYGNFIQKAMAVKGVKCIKGAFRECFDVDIIKK